MRKMNEQYFEEIVKSGKSKLNVIVEVGEVEVQPHNKPMITVSAETRHVMVTVEQKDGTVFVRAEVEDGWLGSIGRLLRGDHPKAKLLIHVPTDCEINAKTVTGTLTISDIMAAVTTHVTTGKTHLTNLGGPIYAKAVTGQMIYDGLLVDDTHRFETVTGELQLRLTKEPNAKVDIRTTTGNVQCDFPLTNAKQERHWIGGKMKGTLGAGTGQLKARVVTGNLHVAQAA
jgi:DUF4097 and DUF4098 domain-containing protein YvlB